MKNLVHQSFLTLTIALFSILSVYGQTLNNPADYHNYLADEQNIISTMHMEYVTHVVKSDDFSSTEKKRQNIIRQLRKSILKVQELKPYQGDANLKKATIEVFELYLQTFNAELNDIVRFQDESPNSYEAMETFFKTQDRAETKLNQAGEKFILAQKEFANKYKLELDNNTFQKQEQLKTLSDVNAYTRDLFLLYFKVAKVNKNFVNALNNKNAGLMDKSRDELIEIVSATLGDLRSRRGFNGDHSLLDHTRNLMEFYRLAASKEYIQLTNIVKIQSQPTKEDMRKYNEIVGSFPIREEEMIDRFYISRRELIRKNLPGSKVSGKLKKKNISKI